MIKFNYIKYFAILSLGIVACEPEFDTPLEDTPLAEQSSGEANFSKYVALGNSLTAGFADGALYIDGQNTSFANLLAQQMEAAGGGEFTTPLMADNVGGFPGVTNKDGSLTFPPRFKFDFATGTPVRVEETPTTSITNVLTGPFNNMGVPGAKSFHLAFDGYGTLNRYFGRFATAPTTSVIKDALAQQPTFFSLWIGNNDVLSYATSGGTGTNQLTNPDPITYGPNDITNTQVFGGVYTQLLTDLTTGGAKGIVAGVPSVTNSPFFTTVPFNPIPLDQATADFINAANNKFPTSPDDDPGYNIALEGLLDVGQLSQEEVTKRTLNFTAGQNAPIIIDESLSPIPNLPKLRQATAEDLIVLTASSIIGMPNEQNSALINGISAPLGDEWVLTPEEQLEIETTVVSFNTTIKALAAANDLAYFDSNAKLEELQTGIPFEDGVVTSGLNLTSAFSLDGIHLNPRGNAIIANSMIDVINEKYGSTLQKVDPSIYKTITIK